MRLQDYGGGVLMSGSGRQAHHHVAHGVGLYSEVVLFGEVEEILAYFSFFFGGTRHFCDFVEDGEHGSRFEVFDSHSR